MQDLMMGISNRLLLPLSSQALLAVPLTGIRGAVLEELESAAHYRKAALEKLRQALSLLDNAARADARAAEMELATRLLTANVERLEP